MKPYRVRVTREARDDLRRLIDFFAARDAATPREALEALAATFATLARLPYASRVARAPHPDPTLRELVVPFSRTGYVVLFRVTDARTVSVLAVRHQLEEDYH